MEFSSEIVCRPAVIIYSLAGFKMMGVIIAFMIDIFGLDFF